MLGQVVVKLNRACNLRCNYCYYINENTPSLGMKMTEAVLHSFLDNYANYCEARSIRGTVSFHGGEPLLMGKEYFRRALEHCGFSRGHLRPSVQTNGILLDQQWAELLVTYGVSVGISLDGPPSVNDVLRVTHNGKGSYDLVLRSIRLLQDMKKDFTVLCVVNPNASGRDVFEHFVDLGIRRLDFLPPISHHARQQTNPVDLAGVEEFLVDAFLAWVEYGDPEIYVRLFHELITRYIHKTSGYSAIGMDRWATFGVLETDGYFARLEELADTEQVDGKKRYMTDSTLENSTFDHVIEQLDFINAQIDWLQLPSSCKTCEMNDVCNGGNIATRFDSGGSFNNPGIHCGSFFRLSAMVKQVVGHATSVCVSQST